MSKKKDTKQTEMKSEKKKDQKQAVADKPAETPKVVEITDRMALLALAQVAGWEPNDPFIGNSPEDTITTTNEGADTELKAMTDDQCKMELGENIGILTPEDQKTVEAMENGPAIWAKFASLREDLSKAKVETTKKETKAAKAADKPAGEKKKGPPPRDADPSKSNKGQVYLAWKAGETEVDKLLKVVNEAVSKGTIKSWVGQWKNGKNLPAVATKA